MKHCPEIKDFLRDLKAEAQKNKVKLKLRNSKFVHYLNQNQCGGWFAVNLDNVTEPELVCAMQNPEWLSLLVHESCHMDQWSTNSKVWQSADKTHLFDNWLNGEKHKPNNVTRYINQCIKLELDCERRSVAKIKRYKLPINLDVYIQKSNVSIYLYSYIKLFSRWQDPKASVIYDQKIYRNMPTKLLTFNQYKRIPTNLEKLFDETLGIL